MITENIINNWPSNIIDFQLLEKKEIRGLVNGGIDLNKKNALGETALSLASQINNNKKAYEISKILLSGGARANTVSFDMATPLYIACRNSNFELVKILCQYGANTNFKNDLMKTPLMAVCDKIIHNKEDLDVIKVLLKHRCDLNYSDVFGNTALHYLGYNNKYDIGKYLINLQETESGLFNNTGETIFGIIQKMPEKFKEKWLTKDTALQKNEQKKEKRKKVT